MQNVNVYGISYKQLVLFVCSMPVDQISYSEKYFDDLYEYR